jgi:hypothetical protein
VLPDLPTSPVGDQTVPARLFGCWRRNWIQFDGQQPEAGPETIWLQTASGMGDLRIEVGQNAAAGDSSCGITVVEETATSVIADWLDGATGFAQQTTSNFPEKGLLSWESPTLMFEHAPSGAYIEEWERQPGSAGAVAHFVSPGDPDTNAATIANLYLAGTHALLAVQDPEGSGVHEYSYGTSASRADQATVALSTFPDRVGQPMRLDRDWQLVSFRPEAST